MKVYVILISRPSDKGYAWPAVYTDMALALRSMGRVSDVFTLEIERCNATDPPMIIETHKKDSWFL